jgi:HSP90 family molecular chaperone
VLTSAPRIAVRSVTDKDALAATSNLCIRIKGDKDSRTLVIEGEPQSRLRAFSL